MDSYFVKYHSRDGWRWTYHAANHEPIAVSSEAYIYESGCDHSITLVKRDAPDAPVVKR